MKFNVTIEDPTIHEEYFRRAASADASPSEENTGFNLILPDDIRLESGEIRQIDLKVRCVPMFEGNYLIRPRPYMERSPLRLWIEKDKAEMVIVDNECSGTLKLWVKNTDTSVFEIWRGERYFQVCHPSMCPVEIEFHT